MKELYQALLLAKSEFKPIIKNKRNPHFKNEYADLDQILACVEPALHKHGLFISQGVENYTLKTTIIHAESGCALSSSYPLPEGLDSQKFGAAITYARRYDLSALLGVTADSDDDGNAASGVGQQQKTTGKAPQPPKTSGGFDDF